MTPTSRPASQRRRDALHWGALLAILAVAALARLWRLDTLPPGLYRDEAINGLDALRIIGGEYPLYFSANNGREPLYFYLLAASVHFLGRSPGALRLVSALLGVATVLASYGLGRELRSRRTGLLLAALLAAMVWPVNLSRIAFRAVSLPLVSAALLTLLWRGLRQRKLLLLALAGALWGLSFYTYLAARFTLVALPLIAAYLWWVRPDWRWVRGWLALAGVATLVALPLAIYILTHWQATMGRAGQVSVFNPAINQGDLWGALAHNLWRTLLGPFVRGDFIPRHNIPLRPALGWIMAPFGVAGLVWALARVRRDPVAGLVLIWCGIMALPTVLAEGAPHFLRSAGVLPVLYMLPVLGLEWAERWLGHRWRPALVNVALVAVVATASAVELSAYWAHLHSQAVYYNFEAGATALAVQVNRYLGLGWDAEGLAVESAVAPPPQGRVALERRFIENWPSLTFLLLGDAPLLDTMDVDATTPTPLALAVWPYGDLSPLLARLPVGQVVDVQTGAWERGDLEAEARQLYSWIELGATAEPEQVLDIAFEEGITLHGYTLRRSAGEIEVSLWWRAEGPVARDYTVFRQALVAGQLVGQADGPPALGLLPTSRWHRYQAIIDRKTVSVDNDAGSSAQLAVGLYDPQTMQRLRIVDQAGVMTSRDKVLLD